MKKPLIAAAGALLMACAGSTEISRADLVNPLQGSDSSYEVSTGNTYPAVAAPWGLNFWTPQTGPNGNGWQYTYAATTLQGFKQTHQPSPWINDYGCFSIMPTVGGLDATQTGRASEFTHAREVSKPYYYSVWLEKYGVQAELTATNACAAMRFTFPESEASNVILDAFHQGSEVNIDAAGRRITGVTRYYDHGNGVMMPDNFAMYFVIEFDKPFKAFGTWSGQGVNEGAAGLQADNAGAFVRFKTKQGEQITVRVASSFISPEMAALHLERELGKLAFDRVKESNRAAWNTELDRVKVTGGTDEQQRTFYTALYRTMLFPLRMHEVDADGGTLHYSAMNGKVCPGPMYTGNGFWDTFRAVHPFFTVMHPELSGQIMQALMNYYDEGGWLPEWFSPGYKDCMIGQHSAAVIADAYAKGIRGFDTGKAWEAMTRGANREGPLPALGRDGCGYYNALGYVPCDAGRKESVSKTLEYAYNDFCIARFGELTGQSADSVARYAARAKNYLNVFDPSIRFVRPKDAKGNWQDPYRPDTWGGSFTEGSAWHWTWCVYHDAQGLIEAMGGRESFVQMLDSVFVAEPTFEYSAYGRVIHEMTEMVLCKMGQYAHGNQPIQHAVYMYDHAGEPWKAQKWVRHIMDTQYDSGPGGLCGDEDNGQTSAWYVFSALGFYPVTPGQAEYCIGSPLFEKAELELSDGKKFTVRAENNSPQNIYIRSATLDGKPFDKSFITHRQIVDGGELVFKMGPEPNKAWGAGSGAQPFSMSARTNRNN